MRLTALLVALCAVTAADEPKPDTSRGDRMLAEYFRAETASLADRCLADVHSLEDWTSRRDEYRRQLAEMLGLDPLPPRTDLKAVVTGKHETQWFTVENLHFQSRPGLYVTGNLYVPKNLDKAAPAVLYVCGHSQVKKNGVSYGNKTAYQHHGGWFARNGYVCLTIDTLQLGEIEGLHHGTYREGMWWWNSRGYTPAGVEAWNCVRALDYLQSRPEVDGERLGVTGRSGGGAYSWWIAALDERIKVAVPVAGITDLENHVVDGCVEGHCDCMFMVNTYRWDYPQVAALVAPRPLLIANTDSDGIFPLNGVERLHAKVRGIYRLYGADDQLGLQISPGRHKDTQELQVAAFRWFNRFLKGDGESLVENTGVRYFTPEELQVFRDGLPADQINTRIHELFVPVAEAPQMPASKEQWDRVRESWLAALREKCFRGWPQEPGPINVSEVHTATHDKLVTQAYDFDSQANVRLRFYVAYDPAHTGERTLNVFVGISHRVDRDALAKWREALPEDFAGMELPDANETSGDSHDPSAIQVLILPRGLGHTQWDTSEKKQVQNRRRFMLVGQTLAGMQVWDVFRALEAIRTLPACLSVTDIKVCGESDMATIVLYAACFAPDGLSLVLDSPRLGNNGPDLFNVLRYLDVPQAAALAATKCRSVDIFMRDVGGFDFASALAKQLGAGRIAVHTAAPSGR
jgi:cephalosporin-C deacetylase-like acetyl esterase